MDASVNLFKLKVILLAHGSSSYSFYVDFGFTKENLSLKVIDRHARARECDVENTAKKSPSRKQNTERSRKF